MRVRDIMHCSREYLQPDTTLREAIAALLKPGCRQGDNPELPVLSAAGKFMGFLSADGILRRLWPSIASLGDMEMQWKALLSDLSGLGNGRICDMLAEDSPVVGEDMYIYECALFMIKKNVKRVPVVDRSGMFLGIVGEREIFSFMNKAVFETNTAGAA